MAKFKREVKEMTTEPSVEPKMKKQMGGAMPRMAMVPPPVTARPMMNRTVMRKKGGEMESPAMHKAEMKALSGVSKELKTGGVANAQGGYKSGGAAKCDYKTGGVANAQGGYKTGGAIKPSKYKEGGHVSMRTDSHGHNAMKKMSNC